jgi:hypothetical protein
MGALLLAQCPCGFFAGPLAVGGGMAIFQIDCGAPARCRSCGALAVHNCLDPAPQCGQCGGPVQFSDDPALQRPQASTALPRRPIFDTGISSGTVSHSCFRTPPISGRDAPSCDFASCSEATGTNASAWCAARP